MKPKIFLLEDDIELNDTVAQFLRHNDFEIVQSFDAEDAKVKIFETHFDLWLMDVKVPFQSGIGLLSELRRSGNDTPAIIITSLHGVDDATRGFDAGCDDYIRKPFALKELLARIEAVIKRRYKSSDNLIKIDENRIFDALNFRLTVDGEKVALKPKEAKLLALFLQNPNKTVTKEEIFDHLWDYGETPNEGSLRTFVKVLRKHLGKDRIETVKEVGYRFNDRNMGEFL
ncbi:response regulator transcription factor [Hydrogenimonas cancrithermarum]|uniref:Two-component response regulator n=1 Tax=Hydrogenimonas cancrithermarum TaxID=2993563 RepID=A0ABN6WSX6_9BACT|nr:response regulator transcription factor [Hydrogenimonas cancrithermarum]BDY11926.1 two-component response regulator [Hydrogenimonas cancrithermarum]